MDQASLLLKRQLKELSQGASMNGFSAGLVDPSNIFIWSVLIMGPPDTPYQDGFFRAVLHFPPTYPQHPPKMTFKTPIWHPNVAPDGIVCISILHEPGEDRYGYERPEERWLPVHTVETILLSVISMLASPNPDSPANVEAAKEFRTDYEAFKRCVFKCVRQSLEDDLDN
jgi:ubiquitin-conjugating enzyme E2 G1